VARSGLVEDAEAGAVIDWQKVALNLRRYKPLSQVAKEVGSDWRHLQRLARGEVNEPRFNTGVRLLDLHYDKFPERHQEVLM
jgi:hypothetical protein